MGVQSGSMILHTAGGRIPLGVLRRAAEVSMVCGNGNLGLGSRQELILCGLSGGNRERARRDLGTLMVEHHPRRPNIVTTRPVSGRAPRTPWLSDGAYDSVLAQFVSPPALPVNLSDSRQVYLPIQTGQINFVAAQEPSFWRVSFFLKGQLRPVMLSSEVHSDGVAAATFVIQQALLGDNAANLPELQASLEACLGGLLRTGAEQVRPSPYDTLQPINGFQRDGDSDTYSLGIPVFNQPLPGHFLVDLCVFAQKLSIATAGITPWQSLLLHGIPATARRDVERLLVQHRVALHTGAWDQVCIDGFVSPEAVRDGRALIVALNRRCPCPGPLSIAFTERTATVPDTPVVIRAHADATRWPFRPRPRYTVYVREYFERSSTLLVPFARDLTAVALTDAMLNVLDQFGAGQTTTRPESAAQASYRSGILLHRCVECLTEYSEQYGDPLGGIDAGTPFAELPSEWQCPTCGAPQTKYITTREFAA